MVTLRGIPDCVVELQRGRVAAVSSDDVILAGLAAQDPQTEIVGRPLDDAAYGGRDAPGRSPIWCGSSTALLERSPGRTAASRRATSGGWAASSTRSRSPRPPATATDARRISTAGHRAAPGGDPRVGTKWPANVTFGVGR